jgi:hypothetical protein
MDASSNMRKPPMAKWTLPRNGRLEGAVGEKTLWKSSKKGLVFEPYAADHVGILGSKWGEMVLKSDM